MAITATTLSSAVSADATTIKVASATGFAKGNFILIDGEVLVQSAEPASGSTVIPVSRGEAGSVQGAHPASAKVITGIGSDFPNAGDASSSTAPFPVQPNRPVTSYSASGAITPSEGLHVLNGTTALAMTLAVPTTLQDGQVLTIVGNGKAAHTVTFATPVGDGGTGLDLWTFPAGGQCALQVIAANAVWVLLPSFPAGTLTNITITAS